MSCRSCCPLCRCRCRVLCRHNCDATHYVAVVFAAHRAAGAGAGTSIAVPLAAERKAKERRGTSYDGVHHQQSLRHLHHIHLARRHSNPELEKVEEQRIVFAARGFCNATERAVCGWDEDSWRDD